MKISKNKLKLILKEEFIKESNEIEQKLLNLAFNDAGKDEDSTAQAFSLANSLGLDIISIILKTFRPIGWKFSTLDSNAKFQFLLGPKEHGILGGLLYIVNLKTQDDVTGEAIDILTLLSDLKFLSGLLATNKHLPEQIAKNQRFLKYISNVLIKEYKKLKGNSNMKLTKNKLREIIKEELDEEEFLIMLRTFDKMLSKIDPKRFTDAAKIKSVEINKKLKSLIQSLGKGRTVELDDWEYEKNLEEVLVVISEIKMLKESKQYTINDLTTLAKLMQILKSNAKNSPESIDQSFELAEGVGLLDELIEIITSPLGVAVKSKFMKTLDQKYYKKNLIDKDEYEELLKSLTLSGGEGIITRRAILEKSKSEKVLNKMIDLSFTVAEYMGGLYLNIWESFANKNMSEQFFKNLLKKFSSFTSVGKYLDEVPYINFSSISKRSALRNFNMPASESVFIFIGDPILEEIAVLHPEWQEWVNN